MNAIEYKINFIASSLPENGASNINAYGNRFTINLEQPFAIPKEAHNVTIASMEENVWNTVPNILTGVNDKFYASYNDGMNPIRNFSITIDQGLYGLSELAASLSNAIVNDGGPADLFNWIADEATQKVNISFNCANYN